MLILWMKAIAPKYKIFGTLSVAFKIRGGDKMIEKKKILIDGETIDKIVFTLKEIKVSSNDSKIKAKIDELQNIIEKECNPDKTIEQIIHEKAKEVKNTDPELHLKLYMLYRNLTMGKVSEDEAKISYENYLKMYPYDVMVY